MNDIANVKVHLSKDSQGKCKYFNILPYLFKNQSTLFDGVDVDPPKWHVHVCGRD